MNADRKLWLDEYAVTCRVFKGRWSIRHCVKMYNDIRDLKIHMSSRARGKVTRHESDYNPCKRCKILAKYLREQSNEMQHCPPPAEPTYSGLWAV